MSADNFEQCLALVLKSEGGFVNNPHDPGGMTNRGVTKTTWEAYVGHPVDEATMRSLGPVDVAPLYKSRFWDVIMGDQLPLGVDYAVFDYAVNSGPSRAAKTLQQILGVSPDGKIGEATLNALEAADARSVATQVCEARLAYMQGLPTWDTFGKGWGARVAQVEDTAFKMVE